MGRHNARLHGVQGAADAGQSTGNGEHHRLVGRGVVTGEAQPRLVVANGHQCITKTTARKPTTEEPGRDHKDHREPEQVALHDITAHQLTEEAGGIGLKAVGAVDQLLLAVEEVEKHQQGRLGEDREVNPLDAVAKHQVAEHARHQGWDHPDGKEGEQR